MKTTQLTRGQPRRLMYVENKDGLLDGARAWVGWAEFSKTGRTVYFHGRSLLAIAGGGIRGNYLDVDSGEEFWVTGVKARGSNAHPGNRPSFRWWKTTRVRNTNGCAASSR